MLLHIVKQRVNIVYVHVLGFDIWQRIVSNQTLGNGWLFNRPISSSAASYVRMQVCNSLSQLKVVVTNSEILDCIN